jgi:hypothetical protein
MIGLNKRSRPESEKSETNSDSSTRSEVCEYEGECRNGCSGPRDDCNCTCHFEYSSKSNSDSSSESEVCPIPSAYICVFGKCDLRSICSNCRCHCHQDVIGDLYDVYCGMMEKKAAFSKMARRRRFLARTKSVDRCSPSQMCDSFDKSVEDCRR